MHRLLYWPLIVATCMNVSLQVATHGVDSLEQQKQRLQVEAARVEELMAQVGFHTAFGQLASTGC